MAVTMAGMGYTSDIIRSILVAASAFTFECAFFACIAWHMLQDATNLVKFYMQLLDSWAAKQKNKL